ncbi:hypothetical protein D9M72_455270 [compost metagenome]
MLESPALIARLHDVAVVRETVEQCGGHLGVAEDAAPFREGEVGGDHHARSLVEFGEQVEQHRATRLREWQVAQFIQDHQIDVHQPVRHLPGLVLRLLQLQGVDQLDRGEEAHPLAMHADRLDPQARGQVGLSRAGATNQHHVVCRLQEAKGVQLAHQRLIELRVGKVKAGEIAVRWEARHAHLVGHGAHLALSGLGFDELVQHGLMIERLHAGGAQHLRPGTGHAVQAQRLEGINNVMHGRTPAMPHEAGRCAVRHSAAGWPVAAC